MLNLEPPSWDELGSPIWVVSDADFKLACKGALLLAHPDKNTAHQELAARAFELVNKAVKSMTDRDTRDGILKLYVEKARLEERTNYVYQHPQAQLEADLETMVQQKKKRESLTHKHFDIYNQKINDKLAARAKRKKEERERKEAARQEVLTSSEDENVSTRKNKTRRKERRGAF